MEHRSPGLKTARINNRIKILSVVGARPNFIKIAALARAFGPITGIDFRIAHTGQHFNFLLDEIFFRQLDIPQPCCHLGIRADSPNRQLALMLQGLEQAFLSESPDLVLVVGDTTSTLAGALAAVKMNIPVAHVEAGLRSGDRSMPEEINRILTDNVADFLFVTEQAGVDHLFREGVSEEKVFLVGNCMIDTLVRFRDKIRETQLRLPFGPIPEKYVLATFHRPSNVDAPAGLNAMTNLLENISREAPVIFPLHPRTRAQLEKHGLKQHLDALPNLHLTEPLGYLEFTRLMAQAALVFTDSGGIQEETTFLGVPCLTLRNTTERPVTIALGTNELFPEPDPVLARSKVRQAMTGQWKTPLSPPPLWDGQAGRRIVDILIKKLTPIR